MHCYRHGQPHRRFYLGTVANGQPYNRMSELRSLGTRRSRRTMSTRADPRWGDAICERCDIEDWTGRSILRLANGGVNRRVLDAHRAVDPPNNDDASVEIVSSYGIMLSTRLRRADVCRNELSSSRGGIGMLISAWARTMMTTTSLRRCGHLRTKLRRLCRHWIQRARLSTMSRDASTTGTDVGSRSDSTGSARGS